MDNEYKQFMEFCTKCNYFLKSNDKLYEALYKRGLKKEFIMERKYSMPSEKSVFGELKEARNILAAYVELLIGEWKEVEGI